MGGERYVFGPDFTAALAALAKENIGKGSRERGLPERLAANVDKPQLTLNTSVPVLRSLERCTLEEFQRPGDGKHMWRLECEVAEK